MARDRSDTIFVSYKPARSPRRRIRFEHRSDGTWTRVEQEYRGGGWATVGREIVRELHVDA
jgi:hypothetical protein